MKTFQHHPVTVEVTYSDGRPDLQATFYEVTEMEPDTLPPAGIVAVANGYEKVVGLEFLDTSDPNLWEGFGGAQTVKVRPAMEDDAVFSPLGVGVPQVPLPLPVQESLLYATEGVTAPVLYAMSDDQGFVVTLMLSTDVGIYLRASGAWHLLTEEDVVDGLTTVAVNDTAVDMFDQFDRAGQLVPTSAMPLTNPLDAETVPQREEGVVPNGATAPAGGVVVASGVKTVPILASQDDIAEAIIAAEDDPDLQWWVERRVKALGLDAEFPWAS